jgi:hypothetical protein
MPEGRKSEPGTASESCFFFIDILMDFGTILTSKNDDYFVTQTPLGSIQVGF